MELSVFRADPAGNITLFVQSFVMQEKRAEAAMRLMARFDAEQVAFVVPGGDADGAIEMMGGEFCGNATRAYGAYLAEKVGKKELSLRVSGCETPVAVEVEGSYAAAQMPLPRAVCAYPQGTLVDLGGIVHFVTEAAPSEEFFAAIEAGILQKTGAEAYGVIFFDREKGAIAPLVKVVSTDTLVWESSCGSGSLAAAAAESFGTAEGVFERSYIQRAGTISARLKYRKGVIAEASIGGKVSFDAPITVEI